MIQTPFHYVGRRIRLIIAATVEKNLRGSILWPTAPA
jgi:hypothetical protein